MEKNMDISVMESRVEDQMNNYMETRAFWSGDYIGIKRGMGRSWQLALTGSTARVHFSFLANHMPV